MEINLEKINTTPQTLEEAIKVIGELLKITIALKKENDELKERLNNNSNNSSLPPSKDFKKKKKTKKKSTRKRGGQPGHPAHQRIIIPEEKIDQIIDCKPLEMCNCGGKVILKDKVRRHQVFEIPLPRYEVIEYRIYKGRCSSCHECHKGQLPPGVSWKGFAPRAHSMMSLLTSKYRLSKRLARSWFNDVYQMPVCVGSVSNIEHTVSQSLEAVHEEVGKITREEKIIHVDETGYKECHKSGWSWIASTFNYTYFLLAGSRGKKIAKALIGNYQGRMIISDRYPAYNYLPDENHQICWAHLKRDFQKISERDGFSGVIGRHLLKAYEKIFNFWKTEYELDSISKQQKKRLKYLKNAMIKWLRKGSRCEHKKTKRTCENILSCAGSLWHFFNIADVSPTNNHAERQLRPLVIQKKLTFGTQSNRGSRFVERIFTVITTCKQQGRDCLSFIIASVQCYFLSEKTPSLVASAS
jgi:transposase